MFEECFFNEELLNIQGFKRLETVKKQNTQMIIYKKYDRMS